MPRSILLGRPVPAPGEPLWLPEDRWWALALLEMEAGTCRDCGQPTAESTSKDNEFAYVAQALQCHGCVAVAQRVRAIREGVEHVDGLQIHLHRTKG